MKHALDRGLFSRLGAMSTMLCSVHCAASGARPTGAADLAERAPSASSTVFREEAVIAAPAERVWDTLVDLPRYAEWNPWLLHAEGDLSPGGVVWAEVLLGKRRMRAEHVVLTVRRGERLCWRDAGWNAAFVYGQRCRTLVPRPDGTVLFRQELLLDGPLRGLAAAATGSALRAGLAAETAALKARVEAEARR